MKRILILSALPFLLAIACVPDPKSNTVDVYGDSVTIQAGYYGGSLRDEPTDLSVIAGLGWRVPNVQSTADQHAKSGRPEVAIIALGINDASLSHRDNPGWTPVDVANFQRLLNNTFSEKSCLAIVLPGYGKGISPVFKTQLDKARTDLVTLAHQRTGPTIIADWQPVVNAHPGYMETDGIHLKPESEGPTARLQFYWDAVNDCEGMI